MIEQCAERGSVSQLAAFACSLSGLHHSRPPDTGKAFKTNWIHVALHAPSPCHALPLRRDNSTKFPSIDRTIFGNPIQCTSRSLCVGGGLVPWREKKNGTGRRTGTSSAAEIREDLYRYMKLHVRSYTPSSSSLWNEFRTHQDASFLGNSSVEHGVRTYSDDRIGSDRIYWS